MALIKFYKNPIDKNEKEVFEKNGTIRSVLEQLNIENKPLCIIINGEMHDDVNIDLTLSDKDEVSIHTFVEGSKGDWATLVGIAAIGAYFIPVVGPGVAFGLGLVSGALMAQHQKDMAKNATSSERAIGLNASAPESASNQARPLEPIPVVLGFVRMAPDAYTDVIITRPMNVTDVLPEAPTGYDYQNSSWDVRPILSEYSYEVYPRYLVPFRIETSTQTFSYGFGSLFVSDRRVGLRSVEGLSYASFVSAFMNRDNLYQQPGTDILLPGGSYYWDNVDYLLQPKAPTSIKRVEDKQLFNNNSPEGHIDPENLDQLNWLTYEGNKGQDTFQFSVKGTLFGYESINGVTQIEMQYKQSDETVWRLPETRSRSLVSYSSSEVYGVFVLETDIEIDKHLQVRIRKMPNDIKEAEEVKLSVNLYIADAFFYASHIQTLGNPKVLAEPLFPLNIEGILLSNSFSSANPDKKYSALVEATCWKLSFNVISLRFVWEWGISNNPAWCFLYFARGGFKNLESRHDTYPREIPIEGETNDEILESAENLLPEYSPTDFWQNYKNVDGNEDQVFGGGYENYQIDIKKIIVWADFCTANNLTISMIIKDDFSVMEALEKIAKVGRASVSYDTGKLSVVFEDKYQVPVTMFGMANILAGSFTVNYKSNINTRKIVGKYSNAWKNYETETVEAIVPFSDPSSIESEEVALDGVSNPDVAQREVNLLAARQFFQTRSYSWSTDQEGFLARRGDLVYLSHDSTQFGYSGRVVDFILNSTGEVIGIKGTSNIDSDVSWVMIRLPNSEMVKLRCHYDHDLILFDDPFPIQDAPYYIKDDLEDGKNQLSRFPNTYPDDYIFTADIKETVGKIVRISTVETDENHNFTYTAVDEDPAMWAFEQGVSIDPESIDDSIGVVEVYSCKVTYEGSGFVTLEFDASPDSYVMIVNEKTGQPIEINGRFSTLENKVRLELEEGLPTKLKLIPLRITERVQAKTLEVKLW